ncbi:MAG: DUF3987 domain-containing protein, partial [Bacteroidales bacterium]
MEHNENRNREEQAFNVCFFPNIRGKGENKPIAEILDGIKNGKWQSQIKALREVEFGSEAQYSKLKNNLPAFTPSGQFNGTHKLENLQEYNPLIVLDIDKAGMDKAIEIKHAAASIEYTYAAFISPSGDGVKILVNTDSTGGNHELVYQLLADYYESKLEVEVDKSGKNINRLCFLSYDPELYLNENAEAFSKSVNITETPDFGDNPYSAEINEVLDNAIAFTEKQQHYFHGNRNNFIFRLANNLNRAGINETVAETLILSKYSDTDMAAEIPSSLASAYKNTGEHGIFSHKYFETVSSVSSVTTVNTNTGIGTPTIPDEIYENLPDLLKKSTEAFELQREKDIYLTGALTVLSGCFPHVEGNYDRKTVYLNINSFIIAPPASGKGRMSFSKNLADAIHKKYEETNEANETISDVVSAQKSPMTLFIPADSSAAAVKRMLGKNGGIGIICETEAETVSSTIKQDWGGYTNMVLKAFQHEPISYARAGEKDEVKLEEIDCPKLSVCLSGTPNQVSGLIKSTEDGLFSRFIFYNFRYGERPEFKNVFAGGTVANLTEYFKELSGEVLEIYEKVINFDKIEVTLTEEQKARFQPHFNDMLSKVHDTFGEESNSSVIRLGLIIFRIAMLLTLLRKLEKDEFAESIECEDVDFETALKLSEVYLQHTLSVLQALPGSVKINPTARLFCEFLPEQFSYSEAVKIG